jgi:hypothetical protein
MKVKISYRLEYDGEEIEFPDNCKIEDIIKKIESNMASVVTYTFSGEAGERTVGRNSDGSMYDYIERSSGDGVCHSKVPKTIKKTGLPKYRVGDNVRFNAGDNIVYVCSIQRIYKDNMGYDYLIGSRLVHEHDIIGIEKEVVHRSNIGWYDE